MEKMATGTLDDVGKLDLRMRLAQHDILVKQLKGMQTDVARSLNVFKRVQDAGPGLDATATRKALDELGAQQSDSVLYQLAVDYLESPTRAGKNRMLEAGLGAKMRDVWFHTYQSNLLNDPQTHVYNIVGTAVFGAMAPIERTLAAGIGTARQLIPTTSAERYHLSDVLAGLSGFKNGFLDGWELAVDAMRRGGDSKFTDAGKAVANPLSAENLSDTPLRLFGKEVWRTPDLTDSFVGKAIDGLGLIHDISFRGLKAGDELVGAMVARYQLHEEAWRFANNEYDRLVAAGLTPDGARAEIDAKMTQFLTERPAQMQASIEGMRNMVTLQEKTAYEQVGIAIKNAVSQYNDEAQSLLLLASRQETLRKGGEKPGDLLTPQQQLSIVGSDDAKSNIQKLVEESNKLNKSFELTDELINTVGNEFANLFTNISKDGTKAFEDFAKAVAETTTRILINYAVTQALKALLNSMAPGAGMALDTKVGGEAVAGLTGTLRGSDINLSSLRALG